MASVKAALKAAKAALDARDYDAAVSSARDALEADKENYFANVFLGRALEKLNKIDDASAAYHAATKAKPDDENAWKGLCSLSESSGNVTAHTDASLRLAELYVARDDQHQCQTIVDKLVEFAKLRGSRKQYCEALAAYLPSSPVFEFLQGRIQSPALTYRRLAEITEADDKERINKEIGERRLRLGAKLSQVTSEVYRDVYNKSDIEQLYQQVIDWTQDDDERREFEEKLLQHAFDHLAVLAGDAKAAKRDEVMKQAHGMVIIKHPQTLAWHIELEWYDLDSFEALDRNVVWQYCQLFPNAGLAKVIQGFMGIKIDPKQEEDDAAEKKDEPKTLGVDDRLVVLTDGLAESNDSALACRLAAEYFLQIEEFENSVETARKAMAMLQVESAKSGLLQIRSFDALRTTLGLALVYYQSPKNHPEASFLFSSVLERSPNSTDALLGIGLIHEEQEDFSSAAQFLDRALQRSEGNIRIAAEAAWCKALNGNVEEGLTELSASLETLKSTKGAPLDLKAQTSYRVGKCMWDAKTDRSSRKSRSGPYSYYIAALKANPSFAPAYTALGIYYADYARDRKRGRQCFQKAFELSASEIFAAEKLARDFAEAADWDIVEAIAARAIDSGVVRPPPGSKRKPVSWPFAAMAVVQMNKQEYPSAVRSYQSALRISPADYNSWVGLGEGYLSSGRYNAASRVLEHAQTLTQEADDVWFARYMHANVHRELGDFGLAVDAYHQVLASRGKEFGVSIALLQTLVESGQDSLAKGFFSRAADLARSAIIEAQKMLQQHPPTVNYWKSVGDACAIFGSVPGFEDRAPLMELKEVLSASAAPQTVTALNNLDKIELVELDHADDGQDSRPLYKMLVGSILAQKKAIEAAQSDVHARAVAWYNLGWTEYFAYQTSRSIADQVSESEKLGHSLKAAVKCFKYAIELEAGNAEFWNALGIVTTTLNPKIAQHSFVRSLHLNERSAKTWVDMGALYMSEGDYELAHEAFARARSTEPDYVYAWLGEGLIALHMGDEKEAYSHFAHAIDIAEASEVPVKFHFVASAFARMLNDEAVALELQNLNLPIFTLHQLAVQSLDLTRYKHVLALLQERASDFAPAVENLAEVTASVEEAYEASESPALLGQFIRLKADLARCQLADGDFDGATENAGTAIDLSEDADDKTMAKTERTKIRLSAHSTAGVANYRNGQMDEALDMFRAALEESDGNPDVVCLLARVLWAKGSAEERSVAKEQLFASIEKHSGHVESTLLLGAMSSLDGDESTHEAVMDDLQSMRGGSTLSLKEQAQVDKLLRCSAALSADASSDEFNEIHRSVMLGPNQPVGWAELADATGDMRIAEMANETASRAVPPDGPLTSEDLSRTAAGEQGVSGGQRAVMLSPWLALGWSTLQSGLS